jgi:hypothetical protein
VIESEIWSLTLREEHRLGVCENRVLRRISAQKRDEVRRESGKLHNDKVDEDEMGGHVACMAKKRNVCRILMRNQKRRDH